MIRIVKVSPDLIPVPSDAVEHVYSGIEIDEGSTRDFVVYRTKDGWTHKAFYNPVEETHTITVSVPKF